MEWEQIVQIAGFLLALLLGAVSNGLIDWLKAQLGVSGHGALALTAAVAVAIAVLDLVVLGQLTPAGVNWGNATEVFIAVFVASQVRFRMLRDQELARLLAIRGSGGD